MTLEIFYDGACPLCVAEMKKLKELDKTHKLQLIDISDADFPNRFPDTDSAYAQRILHGRVNGRLIYGLDVTYQAWTLVGKGRWIAPLRWPIIKPLADACYRFFARHRQRISRMLMPGISCEDNCRLSRRSSSAGQHD